MAGGSAVGVAHDFETQNVQNLEPTGEQHCSMNFYNTDIPDFGEYLIKETFADVYLICEDRKIAAHRSRLSSISPFLASIFASDTSEISIVIVPDLRYEALRLLIHFIYTGFMRATKHEVRELLEASHILGINRAIDVEEDNSSRTFELEKSNKRKASQSLENKKMKTAKSTVLIINAGDYMDSEHSKLGQPIDDPLDVPDVYCTTIAAQTSKRKVSTEQTGLDPSFHQCHGPPSTMQMEECQHQLHSQMNQGSVETHGTRQKSVVKKLQKSVQKATDHAGEENTLEMQHKLQKSPPATVTISKQLSKAKIQEDLPNNKEPENQVGLVAQNRMTDRSSASSSSSFQSCQEDCPVSVLEDSLQSEPSKETVNQIKTNKTHDQVKTTSVQSSLADTLHHPPISKNPQLQRETCDYPELSQTQNLPQHANTLEKARFQLSQALLKFQFTSREENAQNQETLLKQNRQQAQQPDPEKGKTQEEISSVQTRNKNWPEINQDFLNATPSTPNFRTSISSQPSEIATVTKNINPHLQVPQNSNSNVLAPPPMQGVSPVTGEPGGLQQTVQQAVAGLLLWKNSQKKQNSAVVKVDSKPTVVDTQRQEKNTSQTTAVQDTMQMDHQQVNLKPLKLKETNKSPSNTLDRFVIRKEMQQSLSGEKTDQQNPPCTSTQFQQTPGTSQSHLEQNPSIAVPNRGSLIVTETEQNSLEQVLMEELFKEHTKRKPEEKK